MSPLPEPNQLHLSNRNINNAFKLLFLLNLLVLAGTWVHNAKLLYGAPHGLVRLVAQLNLGSENVVASWYSSMLLLLVSLSALCCYFADRQRLFKTKDRILNLGWVVFVFIFLLLSFDEMGSFHEMIGDTAVFQSIGKNSGGSGWYIFYLLIAAVGIFMMIFFVLKFFRNKTALLFAVLGVLLFLSNPMQENYEIASWHNSPNPETWQRPISFLLLEEGSEIFASFCLFFSFATYLKTSLLKHEPSATANKYVLNLPVKTQVAIAMITAIVVAGIFMFVVRWNAWKFDDRGSGIPENWFPSALAFLVAVTSAYKYISSPPKPPYRSRIYLAIALVGLLTSIYFGANMYSYTDRLFQSFNMVVLAATVITGAVATIRIPGRLHGVALTIWVALTLMAFFSSSFTSPLLGYWAVSFLMLGMLYNSIPVQNTGKTMS